MPHYPYSFYGLPPRFSSCLITIVWFVYWFFFFTFFLSVATMVECGDALAALLCNGSFICYFVSRFGLIPCLYPIIRHIFRWCLVVANSHGPADLDRASFLHLSFWSDLPWILRFLLCCCSSVRFLVHTWSAFEDRAVAGDWSHALTLARALTWCLIPVWLHDRSDLRLFDEIYVSSKFIPWCDVYDIVMCYGLLV